MVKSIINNSKDLLNMQHLKPKERIQGNLALLICQTSTLIQLCAASNILIYDFFNFAATVLHATRSD